VVDFQLSGAAPGREAAGVAGVLVLPFFSSDAAVPSVLPGPGVGEASSRLGVDLAAAVRRVPAFRGTVGQHVVVVLPSTVVVALGIGHAAGAVDDLRAAGMHLARAVRGYPRLTTTAAQVGPDPAAAVRAFVEGVLLGAYRSPYLGSKPAPPHEAAVATVRLLLEPSAARSAGVRAALARAGVSGSTANWVRGLVETPGGALTPDDLAGALVERATRAGAKATVWTAAQLAARGFGGVLGVGQGSVHPPRVVELTLGSQGAGSAGARSGRRRPLGLTGKGITFDSGGINIKKDPDEIVWMKSDMAGAAAVAGAVVGAAELSLDTPVRALLPLAENMPGGRAIRPGDVLTHPGGRTSEVTDTDCEGRLVLADCIAYLAGLPRGQRVDGIIDVGTLTDGGGVGHALWGSWSMHDELWRAVLSAGERAGEPGWGLPLVPSYVELLDSSVADIANCSREAPDSAVLAATYLRTFAADVPWVHIDNGSSAYLERAADGWPEGATGSPGRALLQLLEDRAAGG
jgi:leucyl aminopeptidase